MRHPGRGQTSPRLFLTRCAPPSARPGPRPWSAPSSPRTQSVSASPPPGGEDAHPTERRPLHSRRAPFASGRTPWAAGPVLHTDRKLAPCLKDGVVEWPPSLQQCGACALFSYVRSAILTDERFFHFQLRQDTKTNALFLRTANCSPVCPCVALVICRKSRPVVPELTPASIS
jgi:hypothetical protein